jgi:hypothetical protein
LSDGLGGGGSGVSVCAEPALGRLTRGPLRMISMHGVPADHSSLAF